MGALQKAVGDAIRGRVVLYTVSGVVLLIYVTSLAVLEAERPSPDSHIKTFGEAVWWAITTVTTVGYGDYYPVTPTGRVVAVLLMLGGIGLLATVTATLASWIVQRVAEADTTSHAATAGQIAELRSHIELLTEEVRQNGLTARALIPDRDSSTTGAESANE